LGIWELKIIRRGAEKGRCPLCNKEENEIHIVLKCKETDMESKIFFEINGYK